LIKIFNKQFGKTFPEPKNYTLKPLRIMSLAEPEKKMSKSDPKSCLFIDDSPGEIETKLKKAVTGSDANGKSLGAENLLYLLSQFGTPEHNQYFATAQREGTLKYSELKITLAEDTANY
jgi:tryptophanyl-tRNA synthetase